MVGHGGSSAGSYLANPTSPIPSHCAVIILFKSVPVHLLSWLALYELMWCIMMFMWCKINVICRKNCLIDLSQSKTEFTVWYWYSNSAGQNLLSLGKKATLHQFTTVQATSKSILFPGHCTRVIIKVSDHQYQWLAGGYGLEIGLF